MSMWDNSTSHGGELDLGTWSQAQLTGYVPGRSHWRVSWSCPSCSYRFVVISESETLPGFCTPLCAFASRLHMRSHGSNT